MNLAYLLGDIARRYGVDRDELRDRVEQSLGHFNPKTRVNRKLEALVERIASDLLDEQVSAGAYR